MGFVYRVLIVSSLVALVSCTQLPNIKDNKSTEALDEAMSAYHAGDNATAMAKYKPLAEQGNNIAQYNLGLMYDIGAGVPVNYQEAMKWYTRAANQGNADAEYSLGMMYDLGRGVPQDYHAAAKWFRNAANHGFTLALNNLGYMYVSGVGVPQDSVLAYFFLNLAFEYGFEYAKLGRDKIALRMDPAQIAEAKALRAKWQPGMPLPSR